jgi:cellulose synthase/poly-beta-1,6-N-acetylglucosamine synthase-like glycosyltransferase
MDVPAARDLVAIPIAIFIGLPSLYIAFLAVVTLRPRRATRNDAEPSGALRFAVLIPAHDEELLVGRTVASAIGLDYPRDRFSVHVVADNCSDGTAAAARRQGACVHERSEPQRPGKGAALNWLIRSVVSEGRDVDAFVFVDADSMLSPNLLRAMERELRRGAEAVQAIYLGADSPDGPVSRIRKLALRLHNHLRPLAHTTLGGSSRLYGNGMCFRPALLRDHPWSESSVGEDGELLARLVDHGHRVALAEDATVHSVMPAFFREAMSQSVRWERGRFDHFGLYAGLTWRGLRRRDRTRFLAGIGVVIPPVSILAAGSLAALVLAFVLESPAVGVVAVGSAICLVFYVWRGAALGGFTARSLLETLVWSAPYAAWMVWVFGRAALGAGRGKWIRTSRTVETPTQRDVRRGTAAVRDHAA